MVLFYIAGTLLITLGSVFSILRSEATIDYYRTIVRDGRKDPHARWMLTAYHVGLGAVALGGAMILGGTIYDMVFNNL
jgi:hypothetical protein